MQAGRSGFRGMFRGRAAVVYIKVSEVQEKTGQRPVTQNNQTWGKAFSTISENQTFVFSEVLRNDLCSEYQKVDLET